MSLVLHSGQHRGTPPEGTAASGTSERAAASSAATVVLARMAATTGASAQNLEAALAHAFAR